MHLRLAGYLDSGLVFSLADIRAGASILSTRQQLSACDERWLLEQCDAARAAAWPDPELHMANYCACGYRRLWKALRRAGEQVPCSRRAAADMYVRDRRHEAARQAMAHDSDLLPRAEFMTQMGLDALCVVC